MNELIGLEWKPGNQEDYIPNDDAYKLPIKIKTVTSLQDKAGYLINGEYEMSYGEAYGLSTLNKEI